MISQFIITELIKQLKICRPILAGQSMGAVIAYNFAIRFPGIVKALILEDPPWSMEPQAMTNRIKEKFNLEEHPSFISAKKLIQGIALSKKQFDPVAFMIFLKQTHTDGYRWRETLPHISVPLLLLTGDPELGGFITPELANEIRTLKPDISIVNFKDSGHSILFNQLINYMRAFREFLESFTIDERQSNK